MKQSPSPKYSDRELNMTAEELWNRLDSRDQDDGKEDAGLLTTPKFFLELLDEPTDAVLLGQILYWFSPAKRKGYRVGLVNADGKLVLAMTPKQFAEELNLCPRTIIRSLNRLIKAKYIFRDPYDNIRFNYLLLWKLSMKHPKIIKDKKGRKSLKGRVPWEYKPDEHSDDPEKDKISHWLAWLNKPELGGGMLVTKPSLFMTFPVATALLLGRLIWWLRKPGVSQRKEMVTDVGDPRPWLVVATRTLAKRMGLTHTGVKKILDKLVKDGMIERRVEHHRSWPRYQEVPRTQVRLVVPAILDEVGKAILEYRRKRRDSILMASPLRG